MSDKFRLFSPAEFRVYDSDGHVTGVVDGQEKVEIPYSFYEEIKVVCILEDNIHFYEVVGLEEGLYSLEAEEFFFEENKSNNFGATNISTTPGQSISIQLVSEEEANASIEQTGIDPGYSNPFNAQANIRYRLTEQANVRLELYDVVGRRVGSLVDGQQQPGEYVLRLDSFQLDSDIYSLRF